MLWKLFVVFFKINLFTTSGPASYGLTEKLVVPELVSPETYQRAVAISASIPGSDAVQMAWQIGFSVSGILGAIIAVFGALVPCIALSSLVIIGMSYLSPEFLNKFMYGVKPVLFLLLLTTAFQIIGPTTQITYKSIFLFGIISLLFYKKIPIILIFLFSGLAAMFF